MKRVLILVTHLRGTGHLSRALTLARGFDAAGWAATVVSGGFPADHLSASGGARLVQLPPVRSDGVNYRRLLTESGEEADAAYHARRRGRLLAALDEIRPHAVITELFPYGRRVLAEEFEQLLEAAHAQTPRPQVFASIRDILEPPSKPERLAETVARLGRWYDATLVHADPAAVRLEQSWPAPPEALDRLLYTGFVAPPAPEDDGGADGRGEILVNAGSGPMGAPLYSAAAEAARATPDLRWRLLIGGHDGPALIERLSGGPAMVEGLRPDFRAMLTRAAAYVGGCGYNTALDLLRAGTPGVFTPFVGAGEQEQTLRANALCAAWPYEALPIETLTPAALSEAARRAAGRGRFEASGLRFDGAAETVRLVGARLQAD